MEPEIVFVIVGSNVEVLRMTLHVYVPREGDCALIGDNWYKVRAVTWDFGATALARVVVEVSILGLRAELEA